MNERNYSPPYPRRIEGIWQSEDRINFFINEFPILSRSKTKLPIGQYLKAANLLNDYQIEAILKEQKQLDLYFCEIGIAKSWLDTATVDFFLELAINLN